MKKNVWGPCVWKTLHIITIKIKDSSFIKLKDEMINIIISIVSNLPCPLCSSHANLLLRKHKIRSIKTKNELIHTMYLIHNEVNKRLKKNLFNKEDLINKYKNMNFKNVLNDYYVMIQKSKYNEKMLLYSFHKSNFLKNFKKFIIKNINNFEIKN